MRTGMQWARVGVLAVAMGLAVAPTAFAQAPAKDGMAKDTAMARDAMAKGGMAKDAMAKDAMAMAPHGTFAGVEGHKAGGTFEITTAGGKSELRLGQDFSVEKGPDVYVVLGRGEEGGPTGLALGKLKKFTGAQTIAIPAGTDLAAFTHVVLWCKKYDATMGAAPLASADAMMHK